MKKINSIFSIANQDGVLVLREYKEAAFDKIKEGCINYHDSSDFMINASYEIKDGVLYLSGERVIMDKLSSGTHGDRDFDCTGYDLQKLRDIYHIGNEHIRLEQKSSIFPFFRNQKTVIDRGYYLCKKGFNVTYKTTLYKIIE